MDNWGEGSQYQTLFLELFNEEFRFHCLLNLNFQRSVLMCEEKGVFFSIKRVLIHPNDFYYQLRSKTNLFQRPFHHFNAKFRFRTTERLENFFTLLRVMK